MEYIKTKKAQYEGKPYLEINRKRTLIEISKILDELLCLSKSS